MKSGKLEKDKDQQKNRKVNEELNKREDNNGLHAESSSGKPERVRHQHSSGTSLVTILFNIFISGLSTVSRSLIDLNNYTEV